MQGFAYFESPPRGRGDGEYEYKREHAEVRWWCTTLLEQFLRGFGMWLGSRDKLYLVGGDRGVRARVGCECVNGGI